MSRRVCDLTSAQQRLAFLEQLTPGTAAFHIVAGMQLRGPLDFAALERALRTIAERHEPLRASFPAVGGRVVQIIDDAPRVPLSLRPFDDGAVAAEARKPFDLRGAPPWRVTLFARGEDDHVLLIVIHHLICDGRSMSIFLEELFALYPSARPLPELPLRYSDYARWEQNRARTGALDAGLAYWRGQLAGAVPLDLPTDFDRAGAPSMRGAQHRQTLAPEVRERVARFAAEARTTPFVVVLASLFELLARITGQDDIVIGCPVANREYEGTERMIGLLLGTLAIRNRVPAGEPFADLVRRTHDAFVAACRHGDVPFERIVEEVQSTRSLGTAPLFRVMLVFQDAMPAPPHVEGLEITPFPIGTDASPFDLTLYVLPDGNGWDLTWEFATDLFRAETIARFVDEFPSWCRPEAAGPSPVTLVDLWRETAQRRGTACAILAGSQSLSYAELDRRSARLAHHLATRGVGRNTVAGILLERSPELAIAALAILRAGGAYVALDPAYPVELLQFIARDAGARTIVTAADFDAIPDGGATPDATLSPDDAAYLIYTSGSTGTPKGVIATHRGAVNRLRWMWHAFPFAPHERALHQISMNFVDSTWDLFGPLLGGIPVVLAPPGISSDPAALLDLLAAERITRVELVPSLLAAVLEAAAHRGDRLPDLAVCISSGEPLPLRLARRFRDLAPNARLLNLYGSSEVAADVSCFDVTTLEDEATRVPAGTPIDDTRLYVLDERQRPVVPGAWGELYAAGEGLARGYQGRPELTAERFLPDPFAARPGARMFRTGDRARQRFDSAIELRGRIDGELKIRGQRVDPSQIASLLLGRDDVVEAVCVAAPDGASLVAYVVPRESAAGAADLRHFLASRVPSAMVPHVELLDALPRTPNGKIDRAALPPPRRATADAAAAAPRSELELALAAIWREKLQLDAVGIDDNFFEAGGHSLLLAQVQHRIAVALGCTVAIAELFEFPTIRTLAAHLDAQRGGGVPSETASVRAATRRAMLDRTRTARLREGGAS
ncbi:MAG TPA: amino acid adenylation domain-containing protein [Thermoanaerobaculia bacterium]